MGIDDQEKITGDEGFVAPETGYEKSARVIEKNLDEDNRYREIMEEASLDYLKTKDKRYFDENYSGEVALSGYLMDRQGNETNALPSQNLGGLAFAEVTAQAKAKFAELYSEDMETYESEEIPSERPVWPKIGDEALSDKDFMRKYQENGFGWQSFTNADKPIIDRWDKIHKEYPTLVLNPSNNGQAETPNSSQDEKLPDLMPKELTRNLKGQVVNPKTNEPVREGSPEWQELARRNMLPPNQR